MTSEELLEKAEKTYKESVVFYRDKLVKKLLDMDVDNIHLGEIEGDWNSFMDSVRYVEAVQMLQYEPFVREL